MTRRPATLTAWRTLACPARPARPAGRTPGGPALETRSSTPGPGGVARWSSKRTTTWMSQTSSSEPDPSAERRSELEKNLAEVRSRIAVACAAAGRDPGEITLIAITKTRPPADVLLLHELGLTDFGENKDQGAAPKAAAVAAALADAGAARSQPLRWHFVGQLQTN